MKKTKPLIVSDKEKENCICHMFSIFSYWNRYFVIYPHKYTLNNLKKKYQEKWENAYLTVKNAWAFRALRRTLYPGQYWLTLCARLCFATSGKSQKKFLGPPLVQILDLLVTPTTWTWDGYPSSAGWGTPTWTWPGMGYPPPGPLMGYPPSNQLDDVPQNVNRQTPVKTVPSLVCGQ